MEYPGLFGKLPNVIKKLEPLVVRANSVIDHLQPVIEVLQYIAAYADRTFVDCDVETVDVVG